MFTVRIVLALLDGVPGLRIGEWAIAAIVSTYSPVSTGFIGSLAAIEISAWLPFTGSKSQRLTGLLLVEIESTGGVL